MPLDLEQVKMKIAELSQAIDQRMPNYATMLDTIHKEFRGQPELMYKLDDTEIAQVIKGLETFHQTTIVTPREKKPISAKRGASMSEDDV